MDISTVLSRFNTWWFESYQPDFIVRKKYINPLETHLNKKTITFLVGLRRVGKTTLMHQLIDILINQKKVNQKNILYVSLEHPAFKKMSLMDLVEEFRKINGLSIKEKVFLFFDEVHYKEDFMRDLKIIYDHENVKVFASASNSIALQDIKAYSTGRTQKIVIEPLDFNEYLMFKNINIKEYDSHLLYNHFEEYLFTGGMPEFVLTQDPEYIINLVEDIIYKDIVGKYKIRDISSLKDLFILLCERTGKPMTYNKIAKILNISKDTVKEYIGYFTSTYLFYLIEKEAKSLNEAKYAPKKVYIVDNGIRTVFIGEKDKGSLFENCVFQTIKKHKPSYVQKNSVEIDFYYKQTLLEVKYRKNVETKQLNAIKHLKKELNAKKIIFIENISDLLKFLSDELNI